MKSKKESTQGAVAILRQKVQGCVSQNSDPKKSILLKAGQTRLKDSSSDEMDTLRRSRTHTTVVTASGEVQTNEEAQVYVDYLDLFVTVQLLDF